MSILEHLHGCSAEQYKSSVDASHPCLRVGISLSSDDGCGEEGPCGPCPCRGGLVTKTQSRRTNQCTCPYWENCLGARGGSTTRRIHPCLEEKTTGTSWVYPFVGRWVLPTPSRRCWPACEHIPGSPTGSYLLGIPAVDSLTTQWWGGMISEPNLGHCPDFTTTDPTQTLRPTWLLSTDWGVLSKCNTL